jgi:predicted MFS family arabinose efflux permease
LLVSETWRAEHRGKAIAIMQAGFPLGQIFAAVAAATLLPPFGWRVLFFIGVLPALFTLWIRTKVEEPRIWLETKHKPRSTTDLGFFQIFRKPLLRYTLLCVLTSSLGLIGYWGLFSWMPGFLALPLEKGGAGLGIAKAPIWLFPTLVASFIGTATFGFFSDRIRRRPTLAVFFGVSAILVWVFGHTRDAFTLLALGPPSRAKARRA